MAILSLIKLRNWLRFCFRLILMAVRYSSFSPYFLTSHSFSRGFSFTLPQTPTQLGGRPYARQYQQGRPAPGAFREWREYEEAVKRKDLAGALRFLKSLESQSPVDIFENSSMADSAMSRFRELELYGPQKDWEVLDTCLNADDMKLVGNAYKFLKDRGFLPNFGKCRNIGELCCTS